MCFLIFCYTQGLSVTEIIDGYEQGCKKALDILGGKMCVCVREGPVWL